MQGEKAVAVGLSLTLHACVAWMVLARIAVAPGLLPTTPITVSFEAPPLVDNPASAVTSEVIRPSGDVAAAQAAAAPSTIAPVAPTSPLSAASEAPSLKESAAAETRPLAGEPPSSPLSVPAAPLQASTPDDIGAAQPGPAAALLALAAPLDPSTSSAEPLHTAPSLPASKDTLGATLSEQAAADALPSNPIPAAPAAPSQALAVPSAPSPMLAEAPAPDLSSVPSPAAPTIDAARPAPDRPAAPPSPAIADAGPQATSDVTPLQSAPVITDGETIAPLQQTTTQQNAVSASLAPTEQGTAIDLDAATTPAPPADAARAQQIRAFVDRYDGGPCFFAAVRQVSATSAAIESFSTTPDTFRQFDRALKAATGVEPTVSGQRIWSAQCPAVEYLRKLPHGADATPTLDLERRDLAIGDALSGTVQGASGRPLRLFIVSETGAVTDVSDAVSERNGMPTFSLRPRFTGSGGPFPQILVLVAGVGKLPPHPASIEDLFKPIMDDKGMSYAVATKMFLVTR